MIGVFKDSEIIMFNAYHVDLIARHDVLGPSVKTGPCAIAGECEIRTAEKSIFIKKKEIPAHVLAGTGAG